MQLGDAVATAFGRRAPKRAVTRFRRRVGSLPSARSARARRSAADRPGLRALDLQALENARSVLELIGREVELPRQEAQRPAHAEAGAAGLVAAARDREVDLGGARTLVPLASGPGEGRLEAAAATMATAIPETVSVHHRLLSRGQSLPAGHTRGRHASRTGSVARARAAVNAATTRHRRSL
jgi:hypothetical protein